jgi:acyl transferase domain-containing protein/acyl-coenzyme A synthetase/AMP-(fatty) acid ligase/SAM-dependent methyltransferase
MVTALLNDPAIEEYTVLERKTQQGELERVAYIVTTEVENFEQLQLRLQALAEGQIAAFVAVAYLPLNDDGTVDQTALAQVPVLSAEFSDKVTKGLAALPDIEQTACISGYWPNKPRHIYVGKLLENSVPGAAHQSQATPPLQPTQNNAPAAISHGQPLPQRDGTAQVLQQVLCSAQADTPIIYVDNDGSERIESYGSLLSEACRILHGLRNTGLKPGDKVVFQLERNDDILPAFWGCLLGGFEPVIVPVPLSYDIESRALENLQQIWNLFGQPLIVSNHAHGSSLRSSSQAASFAEAKLVAIETLRDNPEHTQVHSAAPDDVAFYTLSSGSTGIPKAVALTHRNLLARARGTNRLCRHSADEVILNWLPFDHIGSISEWHLRYLDLGCKLVYAPKDYILARPLRWLELIHRHRACHSWAPNFAYALVSNALNSEAQRDWDLSCVKSLLTAGESITRTTTREFLEKLAAYGLQPSTLVAAFGMSEVCSGVTYHQPTTGQSLGFHHLDRNSLSGTVCRVEVDDERCVSFASLGPIIPGVSMRIVDDHQRVLPEETIGRFQLKGEVLTPGYYLNPEANKVFGADGWFDTGDAGFISGGELVLTGRAGAGIIINGANFYNNEIEAVVEQVAGISASFTAACAVRPQGCDELKLAIFFHAAYQNNDAVLLKLLKTIQSQLTKRLGIKADYLIPLDCRSIPKTGIGKIQHKKLIAQFQQGDFQTILEHLDVLTANEHTLPDRFHKKIWRRKQHAPLSRAESGTCLVFLDRLGLGLLVASEIATTGIQCIVVKSGESYAQLGALEFSINPNNPQHYRQLLEWLKASNIRLGSILDLFNYASEPTETSNLLALAQALSAFDTVDPLRLLTVSSDKHENMGYANAVFPELLHRIEQEFPSLRCQQLDCPTDNPLTYAPAIVKELLGTAIDSEIAYRRPQRWVAGLQQIDIATASQASLPFQRQAVYIIANGLEGIGPQLAEYLLNRYHARLLLLGKQPLPTQAELADKGASRLADYQRLRHLSGECVYLAIADLDQAALQQAISAALSTWENQLAGVIHLADTLPQGPLLEETIENLQTHLTAELTAASHLYHILEQYQGKLFVSLSSINGVINPADQNLPTTLNVQSSITNSPRVCHIGLSDWELLNTAGSPNEQSAATSLMRANLNAILVALQLNEPQTLIGLDDASPAVRAKTHSGPPQLVNTKVYFTARRLMPPSEIIPEPLTDRYGTLIPCDYIQLHEPESAGPQQLELWPSVAEYFVYDDLIYYALANDERRNQSYRIALQRMVPGKIVLDIGTGKEAILARLALEAGARKVYAIEMGDEAYAQAVAHIQHLGLDDKIIIVHGDATKVDIPELADVCVSEIVGPIGGCEGAAALINNAHRFLRPGGIMIPGRSTTKIAAARFPDALLPHPGFYQVPSRYTGKIFDEVGYPFDLRLCIKNFPRGNLLSNADIFEDLDFNRITPLEEQHDIELIIDQNSRLDGFLVWLNLHTIEGEVIDIIEHEYSWLPVYLPLFHPGIETKPGDRIVATITRSLCENGLNPDFVVSGQFLRSNGESIAFSCSSYHYKQQYKQHPFYAALFAEDPLGRRPGCRPGNLLQYLSEMPLTAAGEIDRNRLAKLAQGSNPETAQQLPPGSEIAIQIAKIWQDLLEIPQVGVNDNFFELGGHSLLLVQAHDRLLEIFGPQLTLVDLFKYPTIAALVDLLADEGIRETPSQKGQERAEARSGYKSSHGSSDIAVIGMSCRFPGADDLDSFWHNLAEGVESISFFNELEITGTGINPSVVHHPDYVKASPLLANVENFDAGFFGYTARDAELMDPQHRLFLECAWEAFENAGYDPIAYPGVAGVYAGASMNTYLLNNLYPNRDTLDIQDDLEVATLDSMGGFLLMVASDKDYLTTRVSYKLNLTGPSVNVQTACSTGLVTIHMACQSLLNGEADLFLAGGAAVQVPQQSGHLFQTGMIVSPDGHCRSFDAQAKGTVFGSGVGAVLLKRLDDAVRDGDHIYAVVKGSAVNNDGGVKVGYMAPSSEGQAAVAAEAIAMSGVAADSIGFVEAHGTGTEMGDPIEVNALTQAFRAHTEAKGFCALGSVKTNVGHLQITSGTVGFIKTVLALQHKLIPATLHFSKANPAIDFDNSPFYVNTRPTPWKTAGTPLRAGVNSLGIGGTNAHIILEEAPLPTAVINQLERPRHMLTLSARSEPALLQLAERYTAFFAKNPHVCLADVCFTANSGRRAFEHRLAVPAESVEQLREDLQNFVAGQLPGRVILGQTSPQSRAKIAFLFTGQGSQYPGMALELYDSQPVFRRQLDRCAKILQPWLDRPLLEILYPADGSPAALDETAYAQPALFAVEYALAELWKSWGIEPDFVIGHSLGEYVAACIAGVFSLEDGLKLVAERARLMQALPKDGEMWVVFAAEAQLRPLLAPYPNDVALAAVNGPESIVISGKKSAIAEIVARLQKDGYTSQPLNTSHAFHSPLMEAMLADFARVAAGISYAAPQIPLVSNLTGTLSSDEIATPDYWRRHIRQPVKFMAGMQSLSQHGCEIFIEIGPKPTLLGMGARCLASEQANWLPSLRPGEAAWQTLLNSLGQLSVCGPVDWKGFDQAYQRRRLPLPTYPFQRQRHWLDRPATVTTAVRGNDASRPLLGQQLQLPTVPATIYENRFSAATLPFLLDHRVYDEIVVSGACHVAMLLSAATERLGNSAYVLKDVFFPEPLIIPGGQSRSVQVIVTPTTDSNATLQLISFAAAAEHASVASHAEGTLAPAVARSAAKSFPSLWERFGKTLSTEAFYQAQAERHIHLGPSYRWLESIKLGNGESLCRLRKPQSLGGLDPNQLHPGLLDACFGLLLATGILEEDQTWLPFAIEEIRVFQTPDDSPLWGHLLLRPADAAKRVIADAALCDASGQVLIEFVGLEARAASPKAIQRYLPSQADRLLYRSAWLPLAATQPAVDIAGQWLIFADRRETGRKLAQRLTDRGNRCVLVTPGSAYGLVGPDHYCVNPEQADDFARLLQDSVGPAGRFQGIVHLWSQDEAQVEDEQWLTHKQNLACASVLHLVQALVHAGWPNGTHLWLVSRGSQTVGSDIDSPQIQQAPLWGLGLAVALEHPELACTLIDLDPATGSGDADDLWESLQTDDGESRIAWRQGVRYVSRLIRQTIPAGKQPQRVRSDATYLITGGTGGLGLSTAAWLVAQGARHLVLTSRGAAAKPALEAVSRMQQAGAQVLLMQADVSDRQALSEVFHKIDTTLPPLRGVMHCAGIINDGMLAEQSWEDFKRVLAAKIQGGWHLHQLSQTLPLDFFVLFSSAASVLGNHGQGNYAAANAFLDGLAHYRRQQGLAATSINWGPWDSIGIAAADASIARHMGRLGFTGIKPDVGLLALEQILAGRANITQISVIDWDWQKYLAQLNTSHNFFAELSKTEPAAIKANGAATTDILLKLQHASPEARKQLLGSLVHDTVRQTLGIHESLRLDAAKPLADQGLDSLMAVQMRNVLGTHLRQALPVSLAFNYPTVNDILDYIEGLMADALSSHPQHTLAEQAKPGDDSAVSSAHALLADLDKLLDEPSLNT